MNGEDSCTSHFTPKQINKEQFCGSFKDCFTIAFSIDETDHNLHAQPDGKWTLAILVNI